MQMKSSNLGTKDLIPAIIWVIIGVLLAIESYNLDIGYLRNPGPGFMPFLLGIILILLSFPILVQSLKDIKREKKREASIWVGIDFWKISLAVVIQLIYCFMLEKVGFSVATFFCLFLLFKFIGSEKMVKALIVTSITVISAYILFIIVLKVQMPSFPWRIFS
jgi:Kef-type K+ transport system membrane component KefB